MRLTNLHRHFGSSDEIIETPDPWGAGIVIEHKNANDPAFLAAMRKAALAKGSPMAKVVQKMAIEEARKIDDASDAESIKARTSRLQDPEAILAEVYAQVEDGTLSLGDIQDNDEMLARNVAEHLVTGFRGVTELVDGREVAVEFSTEAAYELLSYCALAPDSSRTVGATLTQLVLDNAAGHATIESAVAEEAEKNSEASSSGSCASATSLEQSAIESEAS